LILEISWKDGRVQVDVPSDGRSGPIRIDGSEVSCSCVRLPGGAYSLILDGRVYDLAAEVDSDACTVSSSSSRYTVRLLDPRRLTNRTQPGGGQAGFQRIRADMPGKVIRVLVRPGDKVEFDQPLLVLEAMKMQNEIRAPKDGTVRELGVGEGTTVNTGELLVSLE
jgi:biotin carboxyl carrier protein